MCVCSCSCLASPDAKFNRKQKPVVGRHICTLCDVSFIPLQKLKAVEYYPKAKSFLPYLDKVQGWRKKHLTPECHSRQQSIFNSRDYPLHALDLLSRPWPFLIQYFTLRVGIKSGKKFPAASDDSQVNVEPSLTRSA